jgi:hypothetical protein
MGNLHEDQCSIRCDASDVNRLARATHRRGDSRVSELFVEEFAEGGFEFAGAGLQHFVVVVPDEEFVAADASDQEFADLEVVAEFSRKRIRAKETQEENKNAQHRKTDLGTS